MYTSKNTSVNSRRPAAVYDYVGFDMKGKTVLDYGCGKYYEVSEEYAMKFKPNEIFFYDPYWQPEEPTVYLYDVIICSNVLNVISDEQEIYNITKKLVKLLDIGGMIVFQIYEGDRKGKGKETKEDCWQRNEKTIEYMRFFEEYTKKGYSVKIYKNYITIKDALPF